MSILFRYRETPSVRINTEFSLYNGGRYIRTTVWHISDTVTLTFPLEDPLKSAIAGLAMPNGVYIHQDKHFIDIEFRVAERRHSAIWKTFGMLDDMGMDVVLEATLQQVEDVFIWVACGEKPSWVKGTK